MSTDNSSAGQCCHGPSGGDDERLRALQKRIDDLLSGNVPPSTKVSEDASRLFAIYSPSDALRSAALTAECMNIADEEGGIDGLEKAVDHMYDCLPECPYGMVEHAAKGFLLRHAYARQVLALRSLEQLQPRMVQSSQRVRVLKNL